MDEKIFGEGWKHLSKRKILPKWRTTYRHYVSWVALGLWFVCSPVHRSRWNGLSYWHSCEPAFKILLHFGTWISTSYTCWLLFICAHVHNSCKYIFATPPLILYTYIHAHHITFFWIAVYLWRSFCYPY